MTEAWRAIDGYPDYEVSDQGRVRRVTTRTCARAGHILRTPIRSGYPCVDLCREGGKKTYHVHRLVAAAFIGPAAAAAPEVNHIDGDKTHNRATNLEYVTRSGNKLHAYRLGLQDASGQRNGYAKLTTKQVARIRHLAARPDRQSFRAIGALFGVDSGTISAVVKGKTWNRGNAVGATPTPWMILAMNNAVFAKALTDPLFETRFWSKVVRSADGCWLWNGATSHPESYGVVVRMLRGRRYTTSSHRIAYALANDYQLPDAFVLHHCDVRRCCRPDHLYAGTYVDNAQDMLKRKRGPFAEGRH